MLYLRLRERYEKRSRDSEADRQKGTREIERVRETVVII